MNAYRSLSHFSTRNPSAGILILVIRHQRVIKCELLGRNEKVITSDRCAGRLKSGTDRSIQLVSRRIEWQGIHRAKDSFNLCTQARRRLLGRAIPQLRRDDDAGANVLFAHGLDSIR
jgi:hypothetical protein